jgi:hypothetical protein
MNNVIVLTGEPLPLAVFRQRLRTIAERVRAIGCELPSAPPETRARLLVELDGLDAQLARIDATLSKMAE